MKEISVLDIENIRIGQAENPEAGTGCTVFVSEQGMRAGVDIRGGGPASAETPLLNPLMTAGFVHGVVLGGGSAFGLAAGGGVRRCLEDHGIGFDVVGVKVPLVVQSDIFDLGCGSATIRPDEDMGYAAAKAALEAPNYKDGNYGAGCGATVGKMAGAEYCMKTGIGSYAVEVGALKIGAVVALNACGDIFDYRNGQQIAGLLTEDKKGLRSSADMLVSLLDRKEAEMAGNTTIALVMTNAYLEKPQLCKVAGMAHNGYARSIDPVHTSMDGDSIYAVSLGDVQADTDTVGTLAARVISEAIIRAVDSATSQYGFPARRDLG